MHMGLSEGSYRAHRGYTHKVVEQVAGDGAPLQAASGAVFALAEEVLAAGHEEGDSSKHYPEPRYVSKERRVPGKQSADSGDPCGMGSYLADLSNPVQKLVSAFPLSISVVPPPKLIYAVRMRSITQA